MLDRLIATNRRPSNRTNRRRTTRRSTQRRPALEPLQGREMMAADLFLSPAADVVLTSDVLVQPVVTVEAPVEAGRNDGVSQETDIIFSPLLPESESTPTAEDAANHTDPAGPPARPRPGPVDPNVPPRPAPQPAVDDAIILPAGAAQGEAFVFFSGSPDRNDEAAAHAPDQPLPSIAGIEEFLTEEELQEYRATQRLINRQSQRAVRIASLNDTISDLQAEKARTQAALVTATENKDDAQNNLDHAKEERDTAASHLAGLHQDRQDATSDLRQARRDMRDAAVRRRDPNHDLATANRDWHVANGARLFALEKIAELDAQIPLAEQKLDEAQDAVEAAERALADAMHEKLVAESAAALACTRLMETTEIRDRMVDRFNQVEQEIEVAIESIYDAIDRAIERSVTYARYGGQISTLLESKATLQRHSDALGELSEWLLSGEGSPSIESINEAETQAAIDNLVEVFGAGFDLAKSLRGGLGIGTLVEVVSIGGSILTELADLLAESGPANAFAVNIGQFMGPDLPQLSDVHATGIRDYILANRGILARITGTTPPDSSASVQKHLEWLHQNGPTVAIAMAIATARPGDREGNFDNYFVEAARNYVNAQKSTIDQAILTICDQIEELHRQRRRLIRR